ncbi:MAG: putative Ig domain-containing protein [bacterium]|nr:putative Ig domain-containing protein [bacterium]
MVGTADGFVAKIQDLKTGHLFSVTRNAKGLSVREQVPELRSRRLPCRTKKLPVTTKATGKSAKIVTSDTSFATMKAKWLARGEVETNVVDILVAYDKSAQAWLGEQEEYRDGGIDVFAAECVEKMNLALDNSGLEEFRFRLAGVKAIDFDAKTVRTNDGGQSIVDFDKLLDYATESSSTVWKDLRATRDLVSADIVTILVDNGMEELGGGMVGLGYSLDAAQLGTYDDFADHAFNFCAISEVALDHTMTHEVGHNMGAGHADRDQMNEKRFEVGPQLFRHSSAHYFELKDCRYYTIMGYNWDGFEGSDMSIEAPFFSTPELSVIMGESEEELMIDDNGEPLGTELHDNARTLRETFAIAANYRPHKNKLVVDVGSGGGTVLGGGAYPAGASVKLTAKPVTDFVFAGWYGAYDEKTGTYADPLEGAIDYRTATITYIVPAEDSTVYARFVPKTEDVVSAMAVFCETPKEGYTAGETIEPLVLKVESLSLPVVTAKGLPAGLKFDAKSLTITGTPSAPGLYDVVFTVKNQAKATMSETIRIKIANYTDDLISVSEDLPEGLQDVYGPFIPGSPVDFTLTCAANWAVSGLPAGLKFDKVTGHITGTPTKPGASTVYFTMSVKDPDTAKTVTHMATATFIIDELRRLVLQVEGTGTGKTTGSGAYVANKKVSIKATADSKANEKTGAVKSVFVGWFDGDTLLSKSASYSYVMTETSEQTLTASFVTAEEDADSIGLAVDGMEISSAESTVWTNMCGIAVQWPIVASALSETTVKVAGLPAGLKLVQDKKTKEYVISGTPTAASKFAADKVTRIPAQAKITVTTAGKSSGVFIIEMVVLPLEPWAQGTFSGFAAEISEDGAMTNGVGVASMTVTEAGKISGKFALYGTNWTFNATGYTSFQKSDEEEGGFFEVVVVAKSGKMTKDIVLQVTPGWVADGIDYRGCSMANGLGEDMLLDLRRDAWKDKILVPVFPTTVTALGDVEGVTAKMTFAGKVTFAGTLEGEKVTASGTAFLDAEGDFWSWLVIPYSKTYHGCLRRVLLPTIE